MQALSQHDSPSRAISSQKQLKLLTETELIESTADWVLTEAIEDIIMRDILMEIIHKNEVSKMADGHVTLERDATGVAEGIMRNTVMGMLRDEVA